ncbi:unnamed protein product [Dibothriocephalus latus]|uniref:Uncharacterized protein n=1 Tax=Dibothriocephalus latus TaxID=60516 RepID=A0A3P7LGW7_DIBLA|nr:unnamed protein product [Dibothriocephalus latus]
MQNSETPLQSSILNTEEGQESAGDKSFLQEFQSFRSAVFGTNLVDDDFCESYPPDEPFNESNSLQESYKLVEVTDLDEESRDALPLGDRITDTANDTDASFDESFLEHHSGDRTAAPSKTLRSENLAAGMAAPRVPTNYSQPERTVALPNQCEDSDIEFVNPHQVLLTAQEDPILTHDTLVARMTAAGVQWVPPGQNTKKTAHVRWSTPQVGPGSLVVASSVSTNVNGSQPVTSTAISSTSDDTLKNPDPTGTR